MPRTGKSNTSAKKPRAKKTKPVVEQVVESAPVVEQVVESAPVVEQVVTEVSETSSEVVSLDDQFKDILTRIQAFRTMSNELMADVRKLQKSANKHIKDSKKKQKRKRNLNPDVKRAPSGFAKPTKISESLCNFLGVPSGSEMARTEVTKYLTKYIKEHQLQDQANKRIINCDSKLTSLLNVKPTDDAVTYFNLQRFMKPHFQSSTNIL